MFPAKHYTHVCMHICVKECMLRVLDPRRIARGLDPPEAHLLSREGRGATHPIPPSTPEICGPSVVPKTATKLVHKTKASRNPDRTLLPPPYPPFQRFEWVQRNRLPPQTDLRLQGEHKALELLISQARGRKMTRAFRGGGGGR